MMSQQNMDSIAWGLNESVVDEAVWHSVMEHLVSQLSKRLAIDLDIARRSVYPGKYATFSIHSTTLCSSLSIALRGTVTAQVLEGRLYLYGTILVFSQGVRIGPVENGRLGTLSLQYEKANGSWSMPSWEPDESGEWEQYTSLNQL